MGEVPSPDVITYDRAAQPVPFFLTPLGSIAP